VDGDGKYDIRLSLTGFGAGDSVSFTIGGITGLTANDFLFMDTPSAGHGAFYSVAGVKTTTDSILLDSASSSDAVPESASTAILLGLAVLVVGGMRTAFCRMRFRVVAG
jgi:hypothetical protein